MNLFYCTTDQKFECRQFASIFVGVVTRLELRILEIQFSILLLRPQKALERRIPNHILHVQFERKTSVSQSNLLYPLHGVYVYKGPKPTENAKSHQKVYFEMAPKAMTLLHTSF